MLNLHYEDYKLAYAALMLCYPLGLENIEGEIWKSIPYGNGCYEVSTCGRVKSFKRHEVKIIKPSLHNCGYLCVELFENGKAKKCKTHRQVNPVKTVIKQSLVIYANFPQWKN